MAETNQYYIDGNSIIASYMFPTAAEEFGNGEFVIEEYCYGKYSFVNGEPQYLSYHQAWDWLMLVLNKLNNDDDVDWEIYPDCFKIGGKGFTNEELIKAVWEGVVDYLINNK